MDITKCTNSTCNERNNCFRWIAPPSKENQPYQAFKPLNGKCEYFKVIPERFVGKKQLNKQ